MAKERRTHKPSISVLIPALNEEKAIKQTIRNIPLTEVEVIVIDNGSEDDTAKIAQAEGAVVISEKRRGYGYACLAGIRYLKSRKVKPELVMFLDADGSDDPVDLKKMLAFKLSPHSPDLILGARLDNLRGKAMASHSILANRFFARLIFLLYRTKLTDMGPMRIMEYQTLISLGMKDTGYGWTSEMIVKALKKGYSVGEIPVTYRERIGVSKISGSLVNSIKAAIWITIHIFRHAFRTD